MDMGKIDAAVKALLELTPDERAAVAYTVQRESKKRKRKAKVEVPPPIGGE